MIKQAVILAGGRSARMKGGGEGGADIPKPLLEIGGVPIIERIVRKLAGKKVDIAVVVNPKDRKLFEEKLKRYKITYCPQSKPLGTANALYAAKDFVNDKLFLVMMGDDLSEHPIEEILGAGEPTVFGFAVDDLSEYGAIVTDASGNVERIAEKEAGGSGIANTGIYVMPKEFFSVYGEIKPHGENGEYYLTFVPEIMKRHGVSFRMKTLEGWMGINTPKELREAEEFLEELKG